MVKIKKQKIYFRKKRTSFPHQPVNRFKHIGIFLIVLLLVGAIGTGLVKLKYMFVDSDYFIIKGVDVKMHDEAGSLKTPLLNEAVESEIIGTNIFFMDLVTLKERTRTLHPEFKDVVIRRLLPNKLIIQGKLRKAVAQIHSDRYYFVDKEGVLLPKVKNFPDSDFPIISGITMNLAKAQASSLSKFEKAKLDRALGFISEMQNIEGLSEYKLKLVDVADPGNLSFYVERANVEIKIGNSDFIDRLKVLTTVLNQLGSDIDRFKYIDLRFEEPILGPR
ncbi:cell division protein FtsQ/DivIB [Candidatus Omnitrophota bacterium]